MRISEQWLREWASPSINSEALARQLTMAGLEVDSVEPAAPFFTGIVIGEVIAKIAHPNASKLSLCKVTIGSAEPLDIVCGASNVREGLKVAVATVGATLPSGLKIKKAKLRGEPSHGMLCSAAELGLVESAEGLLELPQAAPVGECIRKFLNLDDQLIEVDLTPNRGDCLSIRGIAREVAALNQLPWQDMTFELIETEVKDTISVSVAEPAACAQYCCRLIKGIDSQAVSPLWLTEKLRRSGIRAHSLVVDITNFVMMELGQPLHAFDADKIEGEISVRKSTSGETLRLLDNQDVVLTPGTLVIADERKVLAIAGVMGGLNSAVTDETTNVLLESAFFSPMAVAGVARSYGLATDSAYRFERGVAPELQLMALERASALLLNLGGGSAGAVNTTSYLDELPKPAAIELSLSRLNQTLGVAFSAAQVATYLGSLGMNTKVQHETQLLVESPSHRFDIAIEADLIEEVARVFGYDAIPLTPIVSSFKANTQAETVISADALRQQLLGLGYNEAINYSFVCPTKHAALYECASPIKLLNPLSEELSQMRQGLLVGLLDALIRNVSRQVHDLKLFEMGMCFEQVSGQLQQIEKVAGVMFGAQGRDDWSQPKRLYDYYDIKGDVEQLLGNTLSETSFVPCGHPAFHPGKAASIIKHHVVVGHVGELHPQLVKLFDLTRAPLLFECNLAAFQERKLPSYKAISKYPLIKRDLSFIVDVSITFDSISKAIWQSDSHHWLRAVELFDVYQGESIPRGSKSLAVGLTLQHPERTLVDTEVNEFMSAILSTLGANFNITLRE